MLPETQQQRIREEAEREFPKSYNAQLEECKLLSRIGYIAAATIYQERINEVVEKASNVLLLCETNGKPVDGFRFREMILEMKAALDTYNKTINNGEDA